MDSKQAASVLISPLTAPEPSEETGLNASFRQSSPTTPRHSAVAAHSPNNPFRDPKRNSIGTDDAFTHVRHTSRGSSLASPISTQSPRFANYREHSLGQLNNGLSKSNSSEEPPVYEENGRPRRSSSLKQRYPGDTSHRPLDIIRKDSKKANRASHLNKRHIPGADTIDRLDVTPNNVAYHHEGPFDAALLARNVDSEASPIAALVESNREALKATPPENIKDALDRHRPLEGVASLPSGLPDRLGRKLEYQEGEHEGYGQEELDREMAKHSLAEKEFDGQRGIEMSDRGRSSDADVYTVPQRKHSLKAGLKKRIGSLKHKGLDEWLP